MLVTDWFLLEPFFVKLQYKKKKIKMQEKKSLIKLNIKQNPQKIYNFN